MATDSQKDCSYPKCDTNEPVPLWLIDVLRNAREAKLGCYAKAAAWEVSRGPMDGDFLARCRGAAEVAHALARLRDQREHVGFVPLTFGDYVALLARLAKVSLSTVCRWSGVEDLRAVPHESASGIAKLARGVGIDLRQLVAHVRLGIIQQSRGIVPASAVRARSETESDALTEWESYISSVEHELSAETQEFSQTFVERVRDGYRA